MAAGGAACVHSRRYTDGPDTMFCRWLLPINAVRQPAVRISSTKVAAP